MNINGNIYENIGIIRAKPMGELRWQLSLYPPGGFGVLQPGGDSLYCIEVEVSHEEVQRIARVAPHLLGVSLETIEAVRRAQELLPQKQAAGQRSGQKRSAGQRSAQKQA
ncbi:hypothetical protein [Qipengyuania sp. NPDC077563]|uniref:hypothetical protein n=1 Tax=Qipengyuania sp. NPDC077563 TaxID=3364497 RepID=UPI00384B1C2D